jgi:hypothetical protein
MHILDIITLPIEEKHDLLVLYALQTAHKEGNAEGSHEELSPRLMSVVRMVLSDGYLPYTHLLSQSIDSLIQHGKLEGDPEYWVDLVFDVLYR